MLTLRNSDIEAVILPDKGADIYSLTDRRTGVDVLFKSPWGRRSAAPWPRAASSMQRWVEAYPGGWQVLLPLLGGLGLLALTVYIEATHPATM